MANMTVTTAHKIAKKKNSSACKKKKKKNEW